jgi:hypothetical protein
LFDDDLFEVLYVTIMLSPRVVILHVLHVYQSVQVGLVGFKDDLFVEGLGAAKEVAEPLAKHG